MAKMEKEDALLSAPEDITLPHPATRDHNFVRLSADGGLALFLGHDVMLTLYALEPEFRLAAKSESTVSKAGGIGAKQIEVACIRMAPGAARIIAQNILSTLLQFQLADAEELKSHIDNIVEALLIGADPKTDEGN